jgi:hypothetical protein
MVLWKIAQPKQDNPPNLLPEEALLAIEWVERDPK